ncbi:MAG: hypothetical protein CL607_24175 [Anaerolineaceae bacterium]|nr:hypothetical protein [Anaerolineaceae bacterium]
MGNTFRTIHLLIQLSLNQQHIVPFVDKIAKRYGQNWHVSVIGKHGDGFTLARQAVDCGADLVICVSDNRRLNEVVSGLYLSDVPLAVFSTDSILSSQTSKRTSFKFHRYLHQVALGFGQVEWVDAGLLETLVFLRYVKVSSIDVSSKYKLIQSNGTSSSSHDGYSHNGATSNGATPNGAVAGSASNGATHNGMFNGFGHNGASANGRKPGHNENGTPTLQLTIDKQPVAVCGELITVANRLKLDSIKMSNQQDNLLSVLIYNTLKEGPKQALVADGNQSTRGRSSGVQATVAQAKMTVKDYRGAYIQITSQNGSPIFVDDDLFSTSSVTIKKLRKAIPLLKMSRG